MHVSVTSAFQVQVDPEGLAKMESFPFNNSLQQGGMRCLDPKLRQTAEDTASGSGVPITCMGVHTHTCTAHTVVPFTQFLMQASIFLLSAF